MFAGASAAIPDMALLSVNCVGADEATVRGQVRKHATDIELIKSLKSTQSIAKAGASSKGTRLSTGKSFNTTNRRFRAFLGVMLYGKGFPEFNRPAEI